MADDAPSPEITINIKGPSDLKLSLQISPSSPVSELKALIASRTQIAAEQQRLIYSGKVLKDEERLESYKVQNGHAVHLVKGAAKGGAGASGAPAAAGAAAAPGAGAGASSEARGVPSNMGAGMQFAGNPLAQLEGVAGHGLGGGVFNPFAGMGAGNLNDPNALTDLMNDPETISRMMSQITPEMMDQMIATNPQLRAMGPEVREMMNSPMMRQMMSNPEMIRSMMSMYGGPGGMGRGGAGAGAAPGMFGAATGTGAAGAGAGDAAGGAAANPFAALAGLGRGGAGAGAGAGTNPFGGMSPEMMQQLMGMGGGMGGFGGLGGLGGFGGAGGAGSGAPAVPQDTRSLEERFQSQLLQLNEMGLIDPQQNIRALQMTGGNVEAAIELIFSGRVPPSS